MVLSKEKKGGIPMLDVMFDVRVQVGDYRNPTDYTHKYFSLDYEPNTKDLEEFAKESGYDSALDLLVDEMRLDMSDKLDQDEIKDIKESLEQHDGFGLDTYLDKKTRQLFSEFISKKYQTKFEAWVLEALTVDSSKDLNDLINYDFGND